MVVAVVVAVSAIGELATIECSDVRNHGKPILGVCLGMQAIGLYHGWELTTAHMPRHGKPSLINHTGLGVFSKLPNPMQVGRYHSLIINRKDQDNELSVQAECESEIMAVSNADGTIWGVQFHPESILTPNGQALINNWLKLASEINSARN